MRTAAALALVLALTTVLPAPSADARYRVHLLTARRGPSLFTTFGHTVLRIRDEQAGTDIVYDWGTYDAADPMLLPKFFTGELRYKVQKAAIPIVLPWFERFFGGLVSQELALTDAQVDGILAQVERLIHSEDRFYLYHYFDDNCTTRVRNLLDAALGGALAGATKGVPADGDTYRSLIEASMPQAPVVRWGVYGMLNWRIDVPVDRWQRMFLPAYLMDELDRLEVPGPDGRPQRVVVQRELVQGQAPDVPPPAPSLAPWLALVVGLLVVTAGPALLPRGRAARVAAGAGLAVVGLVAGFHGLLQVLAWLVAPYAESYANGNLVAAHPLQLALVVLGPMAAAGRARPRRIVRIALAVQILVIVAVLGLRAAGAIVQHVEGFAIPVLAAALGSSLALWRAPV